MRVAEIASRAGVSITTVSRVLNNNPGVRPETARQVQKILAEFPYDRHAIRRGPRPGRRVSRAVRDLRHGAVAILVLGRTHEDWFKQPVFASIVSSITRAAADRQLAVRIEEVLDASRLSDSVHSDVVDGALVFVASEAQPGLLEAVRQQLPVVRVMGEDLVPAAVDQVRTDNMEVGHLAFKHLAEAGCEQVACVTSRPDHGGIFMRTLGFTMAATRAGRTPPTIFRIGPRKPVARFADDQTPCGSFDAVAARIAAMSPRPTGIFVTQDIETIALYPCLASHGIRPGQDLRVVSCNNEQSLALLHPRPATIDLDPSAIGKWALRRLINRIARPDDAAIQMLIKPRLVSPDFGDTLQSPDPVPFSENDLCPPNAPPDVAGLQASRSSSSSWSSASSPC